MATLIFGIGIPGSGKTSILQAFAEKHDYEFISIDELKIKRFGRVQEVTPEVSKEIWDEARGRMKECLASGRNVVFDSTFTRRGWRDSFFPIARTVPNVTIEGLFFDIPVEHVLERNAARGVAGGKRTPDAYIHESHEHLHKSIPSAEEDFDILMRIDEKGEVTTLKGQEDRTLVKYLKPQVHNETKKLI